MPVAGTKFHFLQRLTRTAAGTDPERGRGHTFVVSSDPTICQRLLPTTGAVDRPARRSSRLFSARNWIWMGARGSLMLAADPASLLAGSPTCSRRRSASTPLQASSWQRPARAGAPQDGKHPRARPPVEQSASRQLRRLKLADVRVVAADSASVATFQLSTTTDLLAPTLAPTPIGTHTDTACTATIC
jgi:hypothetical protein